MSLALKRTLQTVFAFVALFAVAFVLRLPAMHLGLAFAIHGVLTAPFFAFGTALFMRKTGCFWPVGVGALILAALLGAMSPVMGWGNGIAGAVGIVAAAVTKRTGLAPGRRAVAVAVAFGATGAGATSIAGFALGMRALSTSAVASDCAFCFVAAALAILGALLGDHLAARGAGAASAA